MPPLSPSHIPGFRATQGDPGLAYAGVLLAGGVWEGPLLLTHSYCLSITGSRWFLQVTSDTASVQPLPENTQDTQRAPGQPSVSPCPGGEPGTPRTPGTQVTWPNHSSLWTTSLWLLTANESDVSCGMKQMKPFLRQESSRHMLDMIFTCDSAKRSVETEDSKVSKVKR